MAMLGVVWPAIRCNSAVVAPPSEASVKAVRLFLTWARETRLLDVDKLLADYTLPVGSDSRWMTRLKDGTLLSLRPHG